MTSAPPRASRFTATALRDRISRAARAAAERGVDALLITPSPDYAYLLGYRAPALERLTCLIVPAEGDPVLLVPRLEEPLARHQLGELADAVAIVAWEETDDPIRLVQAAVAGLRRLAVEDQMQARFALRLRAALDPAELVEAGPTMSALRRVKDAEEVERLRGAAAAADAAMAAILGEGLAGRTEIDVSRRVRELLLEAGNDSADFAIVASGPNAASPHHEAGDRVIRAGDPVVLDIGGVRAGYCSDTSRTASIGEPDPEFVELYEVLREAQRAACEAVAPGVACSHVDDVARRIIDEAGYGAAFIHRTGHGIGLEGHEEPYIVAGNTLVLEEGMAFSVEPGIYLPGRHGARIEDIVVVTADGGERLNRTARDLVVLEG
jgi:Xaa-Pro aminopeptidase